MRNRILRILFVVLPLIFCTRVQAQGPAPETAPPLFPGGALISYNSVFTTRGPMAGISATARPTFSHDGVFNFTWGFRPNFDLTVLLPVVTNHFDGINTAPVGGTGFGDAVVLVKYRFYRRDSERGTTQASVTFGPKLPTGRTGLTGAIGRRLPAPVCNQVLALQICFSLRIGRTRGFSMSGAWWPMRTSTLSFGHKERNRRVSAVISSRASGFRTGPMNRRMWHESGLSAPS